MLTHRGEVLSARRVRVSALVLLGVVPLIFACAGREEITRAQQATEIAAVFETPVPYSARVLDSTSLRGFLEQRPEYREDSADIAGFYERRTMQYAWFVQDSLTANARAFMSLAELPDAEQLARDAVCDSCVVDIELRLTAEFFRFADRNYNGHFSRDPRELDWFIPRAKKDIAQFMDSLAAGTMGLAAYEPLHPQYHLLRDAVREMRVLVDEPWPALVLPTGVRSLKPGDSADVVPSIRARLEQLGDLADAGAMRVGDQAEARISPVGDSADARTLMVVDSVLVLAAQRFQARHGLEPDGVMGPGFIRALNVTPATRLQTMLVNMERLRWAPEEQPPNALLVNIPEFRLHVFEADSVVMSMRIVVGADATSTVIFSSTLERIVMSPTWTVPASITRNEILPAIARNPNYLRQNNMERIGGSAALPVIRQRPGPNNALGRVKFMFPNSYRIYMHDTPAKALFDREQRAFSHGCIRLAEPRALAEYLLRDHAEWPPERIGRTMLSGRETEVKLTDARPVLIVYFTSWLDREGVLQFRDDVYGHDRRLAAELFG